MRLDLVITFHMARFNINVTKQIDKMHSFFCRESRMIGVMGDQGFRSLQAGQWSRSRVSKFNGKI